MTPERFRLVARVSSENLSSVRPVLESAVPAGSIRTEGSDLVVEATVEGVSAKELNRALLSALRRAEKRTRLRSAWTGQDGTTLRFFDYVLKKTVRP